MSVRTPLGELRVTDMTGMSQLHCNLATTCFLEGGGSSALEAMCTTNRHQVA